VACFLFLYHVIYLKRTNVYHQSVIDPMTLLILTLAAMRLTRGAVWDKITEGLRRTVIVGITFPDKRFWRLLRLANKQLWKGSGVGGRLSYLVHCIFCTGFWLSATVVIPNSLWPDSQFLRTCYLILAIAEAAPRLLAWEPRNMHGGD